MLATHFPLEWVSYLRDHVPPYATLNANEQAQLHVAVRILVAEKNWEGCGGLEITDEIRVTVAGWAGLLVLGLEESYFDSLLSILVYPEAYIVPDQLVDKHGIVIGDIARVGEAHYRGPVVLSWGEVQENARHPEAGGNVVLHEFAHQLDMLSGCIDGTPHIGNLAQLKRWQKVMGREYRNLVRAVERGFPTLLDSYGAESEAEFFAVATECFFLAPRSMLKEHRHMYNVLREYFNQNPAERTHA